MKKLRRLALGMAAVAFASALAVPGMALAADATVATEAELKSALENAEVDTITLSGGIELTDRVTISRDVVIDGTSAEYDIKVTGSASTADRAFYITGGEVVLRNLDIEASTFGFSVMGAADVVVDNCSVDAGYGLRWGHSSVTGMAGGALKLLNSDFEVDITAVTIGSPQAEVTIDGTSIEAKYGVVVEESASACKLDILNGSLIDAWGAITVSADGSRVNVSDSTLIGTSTTPDDGSRVNEYQTIGVRADGVEVIVSGNSVVKAVAGDGCVQYLVSTAPSSDETVAGYGNVRVVLDCELVVEGAGKTGIVREEPTESSEVSLGENAIFLGEIPDAEDRDPEFDGAFVIYGGTYADEDAADYLAPDLDLEQNIDGTFSPVLADNAVPMPDLGNGAAGTEPEPGEGECSADAACKAFSDVDADAWYHAYLDWGYQNGILTGYTDAEGNATGLIGPNDATTRAMTVTVLWRLAGEPGATGEGAWYADAVAWALENGILTGYEGDAAKLGLSDEVTREQFATFAWRFAQHMGWDVSVGEDTNVLSYLDAGQIGEWAVPAVQWAVGAGVIGGYTDAEGEPTGYLGPQDGAERCQVAAMLHRMEVAYGIL